MKAAYPVLVVLACAATPGETAEPTPAKLEFQTRRRIESPQASERFQTVYRTVAWAPERTAVIVCDMWDRHWCDGAVRRAKETAPRMNAFLQEARRRGMLVVHAPSECMDAYEDHPARRRVLETPRAETPDFLRSWNRKLDSEEDAVWPIDQSDGGCDCRPQCASSRVWRRQLDAIEIRDEDAISDSGVEIGNLFAARGIEHVLLVGVHTNMCVVGRPFGLRNMVRLGKDVALVRDLTDSMYNPRQSPQVSHVRGTELVIEHIEKYICPTVVSGSLLGGPAFRLKEDRRPHVAVVVSDDHYQADKTLPQFADELRSRHGLRCTVVHGEGTNRFPAMEELEAADAVVLFIRRLALPKEQLDLLRAHLDAGRPLVALRTASHAFDVRDSAPTGCDEWPEFDAAVLGGSYNGHEADRLGTEVAVVEDAADHPILAGVTPARWHSAGSLYRTAPIAEDATLLMTGAIEGKGEPLTWIRRYKRARVFYSSLGHPNDFRQPAFRRLLSNAILWALEKPTTKENADREGSAS